MEIIGFWILGMTYLGEGIFTSSHGKRTIYYTVLPPFPLPLS